MSGLTFLKLSNAVSAERCETLRAELERRGFVKTGRGYPAGYRDNDRLVLDDSALASDLFAQLGASLPAELTIDGERWRLHRLNTRFRACRYRDGQSFCIHRDGAYGPRDGLRSWLTLQLYLNDGSEFEGGRTRFYVDQRGEAVTTVVAPSLGTAIAFDHRLWHDGEPVTHGTKVVLRTDVMYERVAGASTAQHRGYIWRVVARCDGSLATSGRDGTVRSWSKTAPPRVHALGTSSVTALCEDRDGRLWYGTRDGRLGVIEGDGVRRVAQHESAILCVAASLGGKVCAGTASGTLINVDSSSSTVHQGWVWSVIALGDSFASCGEDGRVVIDSKSVRAFHRPLRSLVACDPSTLLVGDARGQVHRLDLASGRTTALNAHEAAVTSLAVQGQLWASASEDCRARLWRGNELLREWRSNDFLTSVAFTADGALVWAGYDGVVRYGSDQLSQPGSPRSH